MDLFAIGNTPLIIARDPDLIEILIDHGSAIDHPNEAGQTLLHEAAKAGDSSLVRYVLDKGANESISDDFVTLF